MNVPTPDPSAPIDPRLLAIRVKRVRQATAALATVKHRLATYVSEHAPEQCGAPPTGDTETRCTAAVDGFVLLSCGHHIFRCADHGSRFLRSSGRLPLFCDDDRHELHAPNRIVTLEWVGLA